MDELTPRTVALWRYAILGPLVSARLEHGDRRSHFEHAASRLYDHPDGKQKIEVSARTIENWYYAYKVSGLDGLEPSRRSDHNKTKALSDELVELIVRAKRAKPRRSAPQIIRLLQRAGRVAPDQLSRSTVLRVIRRSGISTARPREHGDKQRLSFLPEHAGDLWVGDAMHGPRVEVEGKRRKTYLLSIMDAATRYLVGSEFRLSEGAVDHEAVLERAVAVHGFPRTYYVDRGAAYVSDSLRSICADLKIHLLHTQARDAQAKGAIERWHRTWRAEVGVEIEGASLTLAELNALHWAWLAREYHARRHQTTGESPQTHFLREIEEKHVRRAWPGLDLEQAFWHRVRRRVRNDNTIDVGGSRFELSAMGMAGSRVEVRYDPNDNDALPKIYRDKQCVSDTRLLDLHANATRPRRRSTPADIDPIIDPIDAAQDLLRQHYGSATSDEEVVK